MKNLMLADDFSVTDDRICPPPTVRPEDLGHLLDIVADRLESGGVLSLSGAWATYVTPYAEQAPDTPTATQAGDWSARIAADDTWIMWSRGKHRLWTCETDALEPHGKNTPLADDNPMITAMNMHTWTDTTGYPWVGTPGMTGNSLLIDAWPDLSPKTRTPRFHDSPQGQWTFGLIEQAYGPVQWSREDTASGPLHGYDLNRAYLSAYNTAELATETLVRPMGQPEKFDPRRGGIWRVELAPWRFGHLLPDPAGYAPALPDGTRWLTTPTLTLLQQLFDRGDHGGFTVQESWTAPAGRITRKWAELLDDVAVAAREPLATAAKQVYKQTYGMWARPARVYRPDWHYSIIALSRANLWRKMDAAYRTSPMTGALSARTITAVGQGQAPVRVETDCVFYAAQGSWESTAPANFKLDETGIKLGHFKPYQPKGDR